jgi:hypothetical protein
LPELAEIRDLDRLEPDLFSALPHAAQEAPGQDGEVFAARAQAVPDEAADDRADDAVAGDDAGGGGRAGEHDAADARPAADDDGAARGA